MCGVWLEKEENGPAAGTYQLNSGVVNLTCEFSSRPVPAGVTWQHRPADEVGGNWNEFACSNKDENKLCSQEVEHRVTSQCVLRTTSLYMSGKYRCQGIVPDSSKKALSSEILVNVVGIEKVQVVDNLLTYGQPGFIEVEVCANPKPEMIFLVNSELIRTEQSLGRAAVSHLRPLKVRTKGDGPARLVAYCHSVRLYISRVEVNDTISVIVRNEGETRTLPLDLQIEGIPKSSFVPSVLTTLLLLLLGIHRL